MRRLYIALVLSGATLALSAQSFREGDIQWPSAQEFAHNVKLWQSRHRLSDDDNFFISRVRPRMRFRNSATQINPSLQEGINDKRLCAWLPINVIKNDGKRNSLPTGEFDSECFTMWSYVDHWGNWSAPIGAIPGNFTDVAHKNGVTVSAVASIPFGVIGNQWSTALNEMGEMDANEVADMLVYYGADGIGYNSEFSGYSASKLEALRTMHQALTARMNELYAKVTPGYNMAENLWYDGTSSDGEILFDRGLASHNVANWGGKGEERTSLFFNYNWNNTDLLERSINNAANLANGRNPLYLYCGINMQGGEPRMTKPTWEVMKDYPVSIGLWGAHSENMLWQSRTDRGQSQMIRQQTYQERLEQWFSGGLHNPANLPAITTATRCDTGDKSFHGMATFMSARSALSWNLADEPFISFFNVGNGKFFNWEGQRANDNEWYNIGIQDYMPTWRWWISEDLLGREASKASSDVKAAFTWDDAWLGGSCLRITGSSPQSTLHLFKTNFQLDGNEVLKIRYKSATTPDGMSLIATLVGSEDKIAARLPLSADDPADSNGWRCAEMRLSNIAPQSAIALLALDFKDCKELDVKIGEVSLQRSYSHLPQTPEITRVQVLRNTYAGIDAKIIFNVANDKPAGEVCYNDEVGISMFKIYSQEEGAQPTLRGATTSWAAMSYATPFEGNDQGIGKIRFGVSAVGLDMTSESPIAWSAWMESGERIFSDEILIDKSTITPGEPFTLSALDPKRKFDWLISRSGDVDNSLGASDGFYNSWTCDGIDEIGNYDLLIASPESHTPTIYKGYIAVTDPARGRVPEIQSVTADGNETSFRIMKDNEITLEYTGRHADGTRSRGLRIDENSFGIRLGEVLKSESQSFSIAGWMKVDEYPGKVNWIDIARRDGEWPRNNWGWLWTSLNPDGSIQNYDQDYSNLDKGATTRYVTYVFGEEGERIFNKGQWNHFAMIFDRNNKQARTLLYINGKPVESFWGYFNSKDYDTSSITKATGETLDYIPAYKALDLDNYVIIGGTRRPGRGHGGLGFKGVIDDIEIWDRAMSVDEVAASFAGNDPENLPEGLAAYFDFESGADDDMMFAAKGSHAGAKGGYFQLRATTGAEGQSTYEYLPPAFTSGTPFIAGREYTITTTAEWDIPAGVIKQAEGSDESGNAKVLFPTIGETYATLTLQNDLGSDSRRLQCVIIDNGQSGIDEVEGTRPVEISVEGNQVILLPTEEGTYQIRLYDISGKLICEQKTIVATGEKILLTMPGTGVYLLTTLKEGDRPLTHKLITK